MSYIQKHSKDDIHKVFISFKYTEHRKYKERLTNLNNKIRIFDDYSVGENEIPNNIPDEEIRIRIRDEFIKGATVTILLNGSNMKESPFIDWEMHASMFHTENNPKMGILVINLPDSNSNEINVSGVVRKVSDMRNGNQNWIDFINDHETQKRKHPSAPNRLIKNIARENVKIDFINWNNIFTSEYNNNDDESAKILIDLIHEAFLQKKDNHYDTTDKLQK